MSKGEMDVHAKAPFSRDLLPTSRLIPHHPSISMQSSHATQTTGLSSLRHSDYRYLPPGLVHVLVAAAAVVAVLAQSLVQAARVRYLQYAQLSSWHCLARHRPPAAAGLDAAAGQSTAEIAIAAGVVVVAAVAEDAATLVGAFAAGDMPAAAVVAVEKIAEVRKPVVAAEQYSDVRIASNPPGGRSTVVQWQAVLVGLARGHRNHFHLQCHVHLAPYGVYGVLRPLSAAPVHELL